MNLTEPRITDYMIRTHASVCPSASLRKAIKALEKSKSQYLPVVSGKKVIGLIKAQVSKLVASWVDSDAYTAADVMSSNPAVTPPETSLYEVLDNTPDNLYGCTVVQDKTGAVVGIFTPREAMKALHMIAIRNRAKLGKHSK